MKQALLKSANILLIEDGGTFKNSPEQALARGGHLVTSLNTEDILSGLPSEVFDSFSLIICNHERSDLSQVLAEVRKNSNAPILLLISLDTKPTCQHDSPNFITANKPIRPDELLKKIDLLFA